MSVTTDQQSLSDWLRRIEGFHPTTIDLSLSRILPVARALDVCQFPATVVTVAGTNGKGSVVRTLEHLACHAGLKVAAYTSPHMDAFNERLRINGQFSCDAQWVAAFERVNAVRLAQGVGLTFFEYTTLAALVICQSQPLDVLILEVGLGGRLDAVNVVDADVAVITSIALDHTELLGQTREAIAIEKAGIIRDGATVVCGDPDPPMALLDCIAERTATSYRQGQDFRLLDHQDHWTFYIGDQIIWQGGAASLLAQNVSTALMVAHSLQWPWLDHKTDGLLMGLSLPGRFEWRERPCSMVLDVAHNPQAITALVHRLEAITPSYRSITLIFGLLADKDITACVTLLAPVVDQWHCVTLSHDRAATSDTLAAVVVQQTAGQAFQYPTVAVALDQVIAQAMPDDLILIVGSFYLVAEVRRYLSCRTEQMKSAQDNEIFMEMGGIE